MNNNNSLCGCYAIKTMYLKENGMKNVVSRFLIGIAAAFCLSFVQLNSANAKPGIQVESSGAHYGTALYEEITVDLEVKVMGGMVRIKRQWKEETEGKWIFNFEWGDLDLKTVSTEISRHGYVFKRISPTSNVYRYLEQYTIVQSENGFRWADRKGNWIDYDTAGKILAYGDRNNVKVSFNRDASGRISQVLDHFGTAVVTLAYNSQNQVISVADYSGRQVVYTYTGNDLTKVKDVRGYDWLYEYQTLLNRRVLSKKTDPEGRYININHTVSPGGSTCVASSGGSWVFNEEKNQWELVGGKCTRYLIVPPTLLFTGTSDAIGVISKNQYFFDAQSQTYNNTWLVNGRRTTQKINLRGEVLREEINGELQSETAVSEDRRRKVVTDGAGHQTVFEYDEFGNQIKVIYPDKSFKEWAYDRFSNVLRITDEKGVVTINEYDPNGNLTKKVEAAGLPEERVTEYAYDAYGNRISQRLEGDDVTEQAITSWAYDAYGNSNLLVDAESNEFISTFDVLGNMLTNRYSQMEAVRFAYDEVGNLLSRKSALGFIATWEYDKFGMLVKTKDSRDVVKTYEYNSRKQIVKEIVHSDGALEVVEYIYDSNNNVIFKKLPEGGMEETIYDEFGRVRKKIDADGEYAENVYDTTAGFGSSQAPVEVRTAHNTTYFSYNSRGWLSEKRSVADDAAKVIYKHYDQVGNIIGEVDPRGNKKSSEFDAFGNTVKTVTELGMATLYAYDKRGNVLQITDPKNGVYKYYYDKLNRVKKKVNPLGKEVSYTYDASDNITQYIDSAGNVFEFSYDADGRKVSERQYEAGNLGQPLKSYFFTYDGGGYLTGWSDAEQSATFSYDKSGRLKSEVVDFGAFEAGYSYTYNKNGMVGSYTGPDQVISTYAYDGSNKLMSIGIAGKGSINVNSFFGKVPAHISYPGGVVKKTEYDGLFSVKKNSVLDTGGNVINTTSYSHDLNGNVSTIFNGWVELEYDYTKENRVSMVARTEIGVTDEETLTKFLNWDGLGNLSYAQESWQYNSFNQLIGRPGYSYEYDANGSQIAVATAVGESYWYQYDLKNQLVKIGSSTNGVIAQYAYDPLGRRIWKKTNYEEIYYLYNISGLAAELDSQGSVIRSYGFSPFTEFSSDPIYLYQAGRYYFYINNQVGAPVFLVDESGQRVWAAEYNELGMASVSLDLIKNPLRNPGQYEDAETGLYYNYYRVYDPSSGRYIQSDPVGLDGGINTYSYAGGNPVNNIDPLGLTTRCWTTVDCTCRIPTAEKQQDCKDGGGTPMFPEMLGHGKLSGEKLLQKMTDDAAASNATRVPVPPKQSGKYTCIARIQDLRRTAGQCPIFGWGWGLDKNFEVAKNNAIQMANSSIGAQDTHHAQWRCVSPKGEIMRP